MPEPLDSTPTSGCHRLEACAAATEEPLERLLKESAARRLGVLKAYGSVESGRRARARAREALSAAALPLQTKKDLWWECYERMQGEIDAVIDVLVQYEEEDKRRDRSVRRLQKVVQAQLKQVRDFEKHALAEVAHMRKRMRTADATEPVRPPIPNRGVNPFIQRLYA